MAPLCGSGRRWKRAVKLTLCLFFLIPMSSVGIRNPNTIFDKKQKLEVQKQLKRLNKPALKTMKMRPSFYPEGLLFKESNNVSSNSKPKITQPWHLNGRCPEGTIPLRRTKEEDLLRASSVANYGRKKYDIIPNDDIDYSTHEYAVLVEQGDTYYGMNADSGIPKSRNKTNSAWLNSGSQVYYHLFQDYSTRLFTFWTNNGYQSGCYNLECPGFVQTDNQIALGTSFTAYSDYGGAQSSLNYFVFKDNVHGHWWLQLADTYLVGYWPSSLFSVLSNSATRVSWGGEVINKNIGGQHTTTQMGSGHLAEEGPTRASHFQNLKVIDDELVLRGPRDNHEIVTHPNCYNLLKGDDFIYYGGPGRSLNCP